MHIIDSDKIMYHGLKGYSEEYKKGYLDAMSASNRAPTIVEDIKKLSLHPTEAVTMFYDMSNIDCDQVVNILAFLHKEFPHTKIIALPNTTSLETCSKDVLENIISMIAEIIESL